MQHSPMKIKKGRPYVVAILEIDGYDTPGEWTLVRVAPPLDADVDYIEPDLVLVRGDLTGRSGLAILKWNGDMRTEAPRVRIWEEVKPDVS